ncbi:oligosaccharide flippase family protein [Arthrobacter sp. G.S.26]|uniref:oligosaccharide flippase family protein n=1 Tax=Arthrobacter sp. G.S.26 TaxID=3433706 RepID=UPI003D7863EE
MKWIRKFVEFLRRDSPSLLVFGRLGASALALISAPIVARAIGPDGRGDTAAAIALFYIAPILLALGIPLEVRRLSATSDAQSALRSARLFCLLALPVSAAISVVLGHTLFTQFDESTRWVAMVGVALCPMMMSWSCDVSVLVAQGRYRGVMVMQIAQPGIYVLIVAALAIFQSASPATVLIASLCGTTTTFIVGMCLTKTSITGSYFPFLVLTKNAIRFAGSSIAEAASSRLDQVLVLPLIGSFQAGIYSVAVTVAAIPLSFGQALGASYFTPMARAEGADRRNLQTEAVRSAAALAILSCPVLAIAIYFGLPMLFGESFEDSVSIALISLVGTAGMMTAYVCSMALAAEGRGGIMSVAQVISLAVGVGLLFLLGPAFGAAGAAVASTISYFLLLFVLISALRVPLRRCIPMLGDFHNSIHKLLKGK